MRKKRRRRYAGPPLRGPGDLPRFLLYWLDRGLKPVMVLATLCLGFCLVFLFSYVSAQPQSVLKPARQAAQRWGLDSYLKKLDQLASLSTRNAELTVLRDNMERTRLMLEAYQVEGGHMYPMSVDLLYSQASSKGFWNLARNPLTGALSYRGLLANYSEYQQAFERSVYAGMVLYEPIGHPPLSYRLYACDRQGKLLETQAGVFTLSNQK